MTVAEQVYEHAKLLSEPLAREALDFVLFPRGRQDRGEWRDLMERPPWARVLPTNPR